MKKTKLDGADFDESKEVSSLFQKGDLDGGVSLNELFEALWRDRVWAMCIVLFAALISISYALVLPNIYRAEALLAPVSEKQEGGLSALASQYSGVASLAGISVPSSGVGRTDEALAVLQSYKFLSDFIARHSLLPALMAARGWDSNSGELEFDSKVYNQQTGQWVDEGGMFSDKPPSIQLAVARFRSNHLEVSVDKNTGFVVLAIKHVSPKIAMDWANYLINDLNETIKDADVRSANLAIEYLKSQLEKTEVADLQRIFYQLIEGQMKTIMLANGRSEYLLRTLDPPKQEEFKYSPKRAKICIAGTLVGFIFALLVVLARALRRDMATKC